MLMEKSLGKQLGDVLWETGTVLVGYADMEGMNPYGLPMGVFVAVPVPKEIVLGIEDGPTKEYYDMYYILNNRSSADGALWSVRIHGSGFAGKNK